jgi:hypothetical protein
MNALYDEYLRLSDGVEPTDSQIDLIREAHDPDAYAARLEDRLDDYRQHVARHLDGVAPDLGITPADIANADLLPTISDFATGRTIGSGASERLFDQVPTLTLMRIVRRKYADPLAAIYREVLGRKPDSEGLAYWRGHYEAGMPLSEVVRHFESSPEARATS